MTKPKILQKQSYSEQNYSIIIASIRLKCKPLLFVKYLFVLVSYGNLICNMSGSDKGLTLKFFSLTFGACLVLFSQKIILNCLNFFCVSLNVPFSAVLNRLISYPIRKIISLVVKSSKLNLFYRNYLHMSIFYLKSFSGKSFLAPYRKHRTLSGPLFWQHKTQNSCPGWFFLTPLCFLLKFLFLKTSKYSLGFTTIVITLALSIDSTSYKPTCF